MKDPTQCRKIIGVVLFLLLFFFSCALSVQAAGKVTLTGMEKQEKIGSTRIILNFSELPDFEVEHNGQRVDLLLKQVWVSAKLHRLPEDETVVKILLAQKHRDLLSSFLLRRVPKQVVTESKAAPPRILIDLFWEADEGARPGVSFRIADMPPRKTGKKAQQLQLESTWEGHWRDFFRDYRSPWKLQLPPNYSLPPLPPLVTDQQSRLWPLQQLAAEGKWLSLLRRSGKLTGLSDTQRYLRNLLIAEAQLRTDAVAAAIDRLDALREQDGAQRVRVGYLTSYAQARGGQPFVALLTLKELLPTLAKKEPLAANCYLLAAEAALAAKQYPQALEYLQTDGVRWPLALLAVADLRRADALAGQEKLPEALAAYRELAEEPGLFEQYLASLNRAAYAAYRAQDFELAYALYRRLSEQVKELPGADLIQFAAGASAYAAGNLDWGIIGLQKASLDWPGSEGGERAELRLVDHALLIGGELELAKAVTSYGKLSQQAGHRMVREEAAFKRTLAHYLLKDYRESVDELMRFRREFGSSKLRHDADVLLLKQLPLVVRQLREQQDELAAVVLVEKNRKLLLRGGLEPAFLQDLADAFDNLGLYERAGRVLLYLFDRAKTDAQRKPLYLPLATSYLKRGEFSYASDYADRYLKKYPRGKDSGALFGVLLDAFEKQGRHEELLAWLGRKTRPSSPELEIRAAWIYWQQGRLDAARKSLEKAHKQQGQLEVKEMALLAECDYQLERNKAAEKIYRQLVEDPAYASQARYRRAQLLLRMKQRRPALKLLAQLVEEDGSSPWGKLAQDLLISERK